MNESMSVTPLKNEIHFWPKSRFGRMLALFVISLSFLHWVEGSFSGGTLAVVIIYGLTVASSYVFRSYLSPICGGYLPAHWNDAPKRFDAAISVAVAAFLTLLSTNSTLHKLNVQDQQIIWAYQQLQDHQQSESKKAESLAVVGGIFKALSGDFGWGFDVEQQRQEKLNSVGAKLDELSAAHAMVVTKIAEVGRANGWSLFLLVGCFIASAIIGCRIWYQKRNTPPPIPVTGTSSSPNPPSS